MDATVGVRSHDRFDVLACVALLLAFIAIAIQRPYFSADHAADDIGHLQGIARVELGEQSLSAYLLEAHNQHLIPAWRAWFYLMWRTAGLNPVPWRVSIALFQAVSAVLVYLLLRRYLRGRASALFGAALWSGAAIGGWDNPLLWIAASHLLVGLMWLLVAMWCVTGFHSERHMWWLVGMLVAMCLSILSMSAMLILTPVLPLEYWLLERHKGDPRRRQVAWFGSWLVLLGLMGCLIVAATPSESIEPYQRLARWSEAPDVVIRSGATFIIGLADLVHPGMTRLNLYDHDRQTKPIFLLYEGLRGVFAAGLVFVIPAINRRLLAVFLAPFAGYVLLVHAIRYGHDPAMALAFGRYAYVPTLWWCVVLAGVADAVPLRNRGWQRMLKYAALVAATSGVLFYQSRLASRARTEYAEAVGPINAYFMEYRQVLERLSDDAHSAGRPIRLMNLDVVIAIYTIPLREFSTAVLPGSADEIVIVSAGSYRDEDLNDALRRLGTRGEDAARALAAMTRKCANIATVLEGLSSGAEQAGHVMRLPDFPVEVQWKIVRAPPGRAGDEADVAAPRTMMAVHEASLSRLAPQLFFTGLAGVEIVPPTSLSDADRAEAVAALKLLGMPLADRWAERLAERPGATVNVSLAP